MFWWVSQRAFNVPTKLDAHLIFHSSLLPACFHKSNFIKYNLIYKQYYDHCGGGGVVADDDKDGITSQEFFSCKTVNG